MTTTIMQAGYYDHTPLKEICLYTKGGLCHSDNRLIRKVSFGFGGVAFAATSDQEPACLVTDTK
jgi:hypothetical protein